MRRETITRTGIVAASICVAVFVVWFYLNCIGKTVNDSKASIALIIPDNAPADSPLITIWTDAAREEGIQMEVVTQSNFLRPSLTLEKNYAGIVLPDSIAQNSTASFTQALIDYTTSGGKLMLVYDAATLNQAGTYYPKRAPLSQLVGIDYALYDTLNANSIQIGSVWGDRKTLAELSIPPGKSISTSNIPSGIAAERPEVIAGYQYGPLRYNSFVTHGQYKGKRLLSTDGGNLAAGYNEQGKGGVLFVNLQLGYLKGQTDGLFLHGFLRYFADVVVALPTLSASPNGQGGLIFNWHVDSNAAIQPIQALDKIGMLSQGPFSIHFTAGPDSRQVGDGLGLNLENNTAMRGWLSQNKSRGDALGAHGGWIHDYFGINVAENNQASMENYLALNMRAVQAVNAAPIREYSAPNGNQPKWVTKWLEDHGFIAYYFTGNGGMAATRSYREGLLFTTKIWSFPVLTLGDVASFEEAARAQIPESVVAEWLSQISDFCAETGSIRTIYSHPPGFYAYPQAIQQWFAHTRELLDAKVFRWYTMTEVADFLNRREKIVWRMYTRAGELVIEASNPEDLNQLAWKFPKLKYAAPIMEIGNGVVSQDAKYWKVVAAKGNTIRFSSQLLK